MEHQWTLADTIICEARALRAEGVPCEENDVKCEVGIHINRAIQIAITCIDFGGDCNEIARSWRRLERALVHGRDAEALAEKVFGGRCILPVVEQFARPLINSGWRDPVQ